MEASFEIRQDVIAAEWRSVRLDLGTSVTWGQGQTQGDQDEQLSNSEMEMHMKAGSRKGQVGLGGWGWGPRGWSTPFSPGEAPRPCYLLTHLLSV